MLIRSFDAPATASEAERALQNPRTRASGGIILDLRGNPGGRLDVGASLLSFLLPSGSRLYQELDADQPPYAEVASGGKLYPLGDGSALDVTVFEIQSANGRVLNNVGVVPDMLVDAAPAGQDVALAQAIHTLHTAAVGTACPAWSS